ncbi:probable prolyl 4-hydroxylase 9 [Olea europaea subsp. europaea]|uniref:Probable prolyl 4-hydroxylase 9 n=1 Tax=Olea europaea subsp. europaea TaxID=158383 RepID=A0A8S0RFE3_OLEEU|nr:probable prolyl 4-hydroxylase 9 [Olea europaea subsp. europaea]
MYASDEIIDHSCVRSKSQATAQNKGQSVIETLFFGSSLFSQQGVSSTSLRTWPRGLHEEKTKKKDDVLQRGKTGEDSLTSIPFQILSWNPRALYFPNFASAEQCKSIIEIASLEPSSLALREGETAENTKDSLVKLLLKSPGTYQPQHAISAACKVVKR